MSDGRWDAGGDGSSPGSQPAAERGAASPYSSAGASPFGSSPFGSSSPGSPFDGAGDPGPWQDDVGGSSPVSTTAPVMWLWLACAAAAVGLVVAVLTGELLWHVVGWVLAGPLALGLLALFTLKDTARRANPWYVLHPTAPWLYRSAVVLALAGVVACALRIALDVGRM